MLAKASAYVIDTSVTFPITYRLRWVVVPAMSWFPVRLLSSLKSASKFRTYDDIGKTGAGYDSVVDPPASSNKKRSMIENEPLWAVCVDSDTDGFAPGVDEAPDIRICSGWTSMKKEGRGR